MSATSHEPQPTSHAGQRGWITTNYTIYKGKKLGPYYVRAWYEHGKRKKEYIKKQDLDRVRAECEAHREMKSRGRQIARNLDNALGNLKWLDRMAKRLDKGEIRPEDHAFVEQIKLAGISIPGRPPLKSIPDSRTWPKSLAGQFPNHLPSTVFTDHFFQNPKEKFWNKAFKHAERAAANFFAAETEQEKWKRWRESSKNKPKPRPLPTITPPDWLDKAEISSIVEEHHQE